MPYRDPEDPRKLQRVNAWSAANPEKVKAAKKKYAEKNKEACNARVAAWREANKERMQEMRKTWAENNKHKILARTRRRQLAKIQRTPKWLSKDDLWVIEEIYHLAALRTKILGFKWSVDHVLPLQGKLVSGLHTPMNLQVISLSENSSKGNRV